MTTRAALYGRISQDRDGAGIKVEAQLSDCSRYCESKSWEVVETFRDDDTSAYRGRVRKGYKALCEAIEARRVDVVVVTHLDRLFRSNLELEHFIALIEKTGVKVYSIQGADYDLSTSDGQFMARIVGAAARKESADKSRRIRAKQAKVAEAGGYHGGGRRPFGYGGAPLLDEHGNAKKRSDGTPLMDYRVIREDEAQLIQEAARRVLSGESTWSILRDWTARDVPTPGGGPWNNRSLTQILCSARVAGKRSHHGVIVAEADWPAILDEETWLGVRAKLTGRPASVGRRPTYLLSGLVVCQCGSKMRSQTVRGRRRYTCVSGPTGGCGKVSRDAERLERFVAKWVLLLGGFGALPAENPESAAPEIGGLEARIVRLAEEYDDGEMTRDEYLYRRDRLEAKLSDARAQESVRLPGGRRRIGPGGWWDGASDDQKRAAVRDLVRSVTPHPTGRGYRGDTTWENTDLDWTEKGRHFMSQIEDQAIRDALEDGAA